MMKVDLKNVKDIGKNPKGLLLTLIIIFSFQGNAILNNPLHIGLITLIDRQNHHLCQPLLYQVATAGLAMPKIAEPVRTILRAELKECVLL